jgi:hypothetical protein
MRVGSRSPRLEDKLVAEAVEHFSIGFPNLRRDGCPRAQRLREAAVLPARMTPDLQAHLFRCSPCFVKFREYRRARSM